MSQTWYAVLSTHDPCKLLFSVMEVLNLLFSILKVDGLIRLMEGEHTGPINLGNPGNSYPEFVVLHNK